MRKSYKFSETATSEEPKGKMVEYFYKLSNKEKLTRKEKDHLFHTLQSNSGKAYYRLMGWIFDFDQFFEKFIIKYSYEYGCWTEISAPDKMSIRNSFYTGKNIVEIKHLNLKTPSK